MRQAIAKHLAMLAEAGLVMAEPGERRRVRYRLRSAPMRVAQQFLARWPGTGTARPAPVVSYANGKGDRDHLRPGGGPGPGATFARLGFPGGCWSPRLVRWQIACGPLLYIMFIIGQFERKRDKQVPL
jgi:hypothetical protein